MAAGGLTARPVPGRVSWVAAICAIAAVLLAGIAADVARTPYHHKLSALVHMSASDGVAAGARAADPGFAFVPPTSHYDGTYFYAVARDPFARGVQHTQIDRPAYRYGHAFYGQVVALLSAGYPAAVPFWLLAVSLLAMGVAAACASLLAAGWGWSPWSGLAVALSPGLLYAVTVDTAEPLVAALLGLSLLAWTRRRLLPAAVAFAALALTKEPMAAVPVGIGLYELVRIWRRDRQLLPAGWSDPRWRRRAVGGVAALAAGPVVLLGWLLYVEHVFGVWPLSQSGGLVGAPFSGLRDSLETAAG
ncbi:MAG TPA: hypothetical protein VHC41_10370, partial [Mycobacteriales bacterium]|nr:hypothetical protein [Mycobacteriales bacterium]